MIIPEGAFSALESLGISPSSQSAPIVSENKFGDFLGGNPFITGPTYRAGKSAERQGNPLLGNIFGSNSNTRNAGQGGLINASFRVTDNPLVIGMAAAGALAVYFLMKG